MIAPPPFSTRFRMFSGSSLWKLNQLWTACTSPITPLRTRRTASSQIGWSRYMNASAASPRRLRRQPPSPRPARRSSPAASRRECACPRPQPSSSTRRACRSGVGCTPRRHSRRQAIPRRSHRPSVSRGGRRQRPRSPDCREAIATTSQFSAAWMAGVTFSIPISAVLRMPHRTLVISRSFVVPAPYASHRADTKARWLPSWAAEVDRHISDVACHPNVGSSLGEHSLDLGRRMPVGVRTDADDGERRQRLRRAMQDRLSRIHGAGPARCPVAGAAVPAVPPLRCLPAAGGSCRPVPTARSNRRCVLRSVFSVPAPRGRCRQGRTRCRGRPGRSEHRPP